MSSNADWCSSNDVLSSVIKKIKSDKGPPPLMEISVTTGNNCLPLFSSWSCLIWRFSCWIPRTRLERGRCLATWFSVSISSWYWQEITKSQFFSIQFLYIYASTYFKNNVHKTSIITQNHFTCFMASTRLLSDVVCSINISAALSWLRSLSTKDLASAKTFSKEQFIPEQIEIHYYWKGHGLLHA